MDPKDQDSIIQKSGVIYKFKSHRVECGEAYIGEFSKIFGERFKEHLKVPYPVYDHCTIAGHTTTVDNFKIKGSKDWNIAITIKESIYMNLNGPSPNKNIGKYHLPNICDKILFNTPERKLKHHNATVAIPSVTWAQNLPNIVHHKRLQYLPQLGITFVNTISTKMAITSVKMATPSDT